VVYISMCCDVHKQTLGCYNRKPNKHYLEARMLQQTQSTYFNTLPQSQLNQVEIVMKQIKFRSR
jgi:hypothetical protein